MKTLAFVIGVYLTALGAVGMVAPSVLVWIAQRTTTPVELYVVAVFRVALGLLLLWVASASRAPRTLRVVAILPLITGIATPFGVERAPAMIDWWSQQGPWVVRLTAVPLMALGGVIAYACAPARRAV